MTTIVGTTFPNLFEKHFPPGHKMFNKNNMSISYSCLKNMQQILHSNNAETMEQANHKPLEHTCNCRQNNCLAGDIANKETVTVDNKPPSLYIGLAGGPNQN